MKTIKTAKIIKMSAILAFAVLLISHIASASAEDLVFSVDMTYTDKALVFNGAEIIQGEAPSFLLQPESGFDARLMSFNGEELFRFNFSASLDVYDMPEPMLSLPLALIFPYFPNAEELNIYEEGKLALRVDLSEFAVCNENKICEPEFETKICSDCIFEEAGEAPAEEIIPEKELAEIEELPEEWVGIKEKLSSPANIAVIAAALLALFMLIAILRKRKKQ